MMEVEQEKTTTQATTDNVAELLKEHQHDEFYPTPGILKMILDFKQMEPLKEDDPEYKRLNVLLSAQYHHYTNFESIAIAKAVVAFFKIHVAYALAEGFKQHQPDFEQLTEIINAAMPAHHKKLCEKDHAIMADFYGFMLRRKIENRNVFIVHARDPTQFELIDLLESDDKRRRITCDECGHCHKRDVSLHKCSICNRAAYCTKECQRGDWSFHKQFCKHLVKSTGK